MKHLLIVAHGSRREESNDEVRALARRIDALDNGVFDSTRAAFLELAEPSIPEGIQACIDAGAREILVLPYFLSAGRHVSQDIPAAVAVKQRQHPDIPIRLTPWLGSAAGIAGLVLETALAVHEATPGKKME